MLKQLVKLSVLNPNISHRDTLSKMLRNPHTWFIFCIMVILSLFYYLDIVYLGHNYPWMWRIRVFEILNDMTGSLFYIIIIYSGIVLGWLGLTASWVLILAIALPVVIHFNLGPYSLFSNIVFLTGPVMIILFILNLINWFSREKQTLKEREEERQAYMEQIFKTQEEERKSISRALHDNTIQNLLALSNQMQSMLNRESNTLSPSIKQRIDSLSNSICTISDDLRQMSIDLRPSILDDIGLIEALRSLINNNTSDVVQIELIINGDARRLTSDIDVIVYRFVQEAINNTIRHASATKVKLFVNFDPKSIKITVQDNGIGFVLPSNFYELITKKKLGIIGMYERAKMLGGHLDIQSIPGRGTSLYLEFKS